jgi:hypothetical protein
MRLNPAAFDAHLNNIGQSLEWRRSYSCACISPSSGLADPKHQLCMGKGRIWDASLPTVAGVASQKVQAEWMQGGMYESGDMVLSIPQTSVMYDAGQFDRVLMKNSTDVFSISLTRGASNERLLFNVVDVQRVFWLHPQTREIVDGVAPVVSSTGVLTWPGNDGPPDGFVYSMTGRKFTEYFVYQQYLSDRGEHQGARLPKRLILRKWDLFGR